MRFKVTIYPEAKKKLEQSGLAERVRKAHEADKLPTSWGTVLPSEFRSCVDELKSRKFLAKKYLSTDLGKEYQKKLQAWVNDSRVWKVMTDKGERSEPSENDDFPYLCGYFAAGVLRTNEFWDAKKFGFDSVFDMWGCIGALATEIERGTDYREGYVWETNLPNGQHFVSRVTGSTDGDFRLHRTDISPYETYDPLGNKVNYRPELRDDDQCVAAGHSVEDFLLAHIIKFVEQEKIPARSLSPGGFQEIIDEVTGKGLRAGNYADFGQARMGGSKGHFLHHDRPFPKYEDEERLKFNPYWLPFYASEGGYSLCLGKDKSLIFERVDRKLESRTIAFEIPANEVDSLVRGLFHQAGQGLGRTSVNQLADVVKYRNSPEYEQDQKGWAEMRKK